MKNQGIALTAGVWCFFVTAACCLLGMYVEGDMASTALNVITPFVLGLLWGLDSFRRSRRRKNKRLTGNKSKLVLCVSGSWSILDWLPAFPIYFWG